MTKTSAPDAADSPASTVGRRGAAEIPPLQRVLLGVLGALAAGGGALLALRPHSPELGGTALFIIAALFFVLMVIGRLPKSLEVTGVPLEFEQDEMAEFLRTLRAAVDTDTVSELEEQLWRMTGNAKTFRAAQTRADTDPESTSAALDTRSMSATAQEPGWLAELKRSAGTVTVENNARVPGGTGSGRGQPPVVDHLVRVDDEARLAIERTSAWNESTLRVVERRLNRVASNLPTIQRLLVIMPEAGMADAVKWHARHWGDASIPKVQLLAENSDDAIAVEKWIGSLPSPRS